MRSELNSLYAFVQFQQKNSVEQVLSTSSHIVSDCDVDVLSADVWHQPETEIKNPLLFPPAQESPSNIVNALNDDCFREIFRGLNLKELGIAAEVCVRFKKLAEETFTRKYKNVIQLHNFNLRFDEFEHVLRIFGSLTNSISINWKNEIDMFGLIHQHCSSKLRELNFTCISSNVHTFNGALENLEVLDLSNNRLPLEGTLPKLEEATFHMSAFLSSNTTLKKLSIFDMDVGERSLPTKTFHSLSQMVHSFEEIEIDTNWANWFKFVKDIGASEENFSLKVVKLKRSNASESARLLKVLVDKRAPVEHLVLENKYCSVVKSKRIRRIVQMKGIKVLHFRNIMMCTHHIINMAQGLPWLEEFHLGFDSLSVVREILMKYITPEELKEILTHANNLKLLKLNHRNVYIGFVEYREILQIVRNRPTNIGLTIDLSISRSKVDVPKEILLQNQHILRLDVHPTHQIFTSTWQWHNTPFE